MLHARMFIAGTLLALVFPLLVSAATLPELQARLQLLLAQITSLQFSSSGEVLGATICPNFTRNLFRGTRGADVVQLQEFLIAQGHLAASNTTGFFGTETEKAVQAFQCKHAIICGGGILAGYGQVGPATRAKIASVCASPSAAPIPVPLPAPAPQTPLLPAVPTTPTAPQPQSSSSADTYVADVQTRTASIARGAWNAGTFIEAYHGGLTQQKYSYAPAVVRVGSVDHVFTCANSQSGVIRDEIHYTQRDAQTGAVLAATKPVLFPSALGSNLWDQQHVCDPSVIALKARLNGEDFAYAMFYTATAKDASEYNQIGIALAKDIAGPWVKYPYPLVFHPQVPMEADKKRVQFAKLSVAGPWGVGMPTATAVNQNQFLLAYNVGDSSGTRAEVRTITITDLDTSGPQASAPRPLTLSDGAIVGEPLRDIDMAYDPKSDRIVLAVDRFYDKNWSARKAPVFLSDAIQVGSTPGGYLWSGAVAPWQQLGLLDVTNDGPTAVFRRHHSPGIVRTIYGTLPDATKLEMYWASSCTVETVVGTKRACPGNLSRPEFTSEIWKSVMPMSL